jgi:hypothetical protein
MCTLLDSKSGKKEAQFASKNVKTPLYLSPDGKLFMFVRDNTHFRLPLRCGWDDEHDVVVYEVASRRQSVITTVCGGYPYTELRWYRKSAP